MKTFVHFEHSTKETKQGHAKQRVRVMVFNATFNSVSVISWQSVLLVEESTDLLQGTDKLYHIKLYLVHFAISRIRTQNYSGVRHLLHR